MSKNGKGSNWLTKPVRDKMADPGQKTKKLTAARKKTIVWVNVTGLDRRKLLKALWDNAQCREAYREAVLIDASLPAPEDFPEERIMQALQGENTPFAQGAYPRVDYVVGRAIKASVFAAENKVDACNYDIIWGKGAFARVVSSLRKSKK
jgi:hypothetical protein